MRRGLAVACITVAALAACAGVIGQQVKRTATAELGFGELEWNWDTNVIEMTGNCWVNVKDRHTAKLEAPSMTVQINDEVNRVEKLVAAGPVKFEVLTVPNREGIRRKIVGSCTDKATYEEQQQLFQLQGNAVADVTTLPEGNVEAAHLAGQVITANLKTSKITVSRGEMKVTTELDTEKGEQ